MLSHIEIDKRCLKTNDYNFLIEVERMDSPTTTTLKKTFSHNAEYGGFSTEFIFPGPNIIKENGKYRITVKYPKKLENDRDRKIVQALFKRDTSSRFENPYYLQGEIGIKITIHPNDSSEKTCFRSRLFFIEPE